MVYHTERGLKVGQRTFRYAHSRIKEAPLSREISVLKAQRRSFDRASDKIISRDLIEVTICLKRNTNNYVRFLIPRISTKLFQFK